MISLADRELHNVDAALHDTKRIAFAVDGVAGSLAPDRFRRYFPTKDWEPVSTQISVGDVPSLVRKLGGTSLYGKDFKVPLRELIQNSRDAIVARRVKEEREDSWGTVTVSLTSGEQGDKLEVRDTGLGMSRRLLCGPFLDFGASYWHSSLMIEEHPGLAASAFEPQGRYGIGFFSVFMIGERVAVVTRRPEDSVESTRVLEFKTGLSNRPTLRIATEEERLMDAGTAVTVWLSKKAKDDGSILGRSTYQTMFGHTYEKREWTLSDLCEWLCPVIDVDIATKQESTKANPEVDPKNWTA